MGAGFFDHNYVIAVGTLEIGFRSLDLVQIHFIFFAALFTDDNHT
jgi:hypothetical protein